jgi:hypothetical protein
MIASSDLLAFGQEARGCALQMVNNETYIENLANGIE